MPLKSFLLGDANLAPNVLPGPLVGLSCLKCQLDKSKGPSACLW